MRPSNLPAQRFAAIPCAGCRSLLALCRRDDRLGVPAPPRRRRRLLRSPYAPHEVIVGYAPAPPRRRAGRPLLGRAGANGARRARTRLLHLAPA